MDLFQAMEISATGLSAQRTVTQVIAENLANIQTTRTEPGGPYRRQKAVLSSSPISGRFPDLLGRASRTIPGVKAEATPDEARAPELIYDPGHPHADESGWVAFPNINLLEEMVQLLGAARSYEANVAAFNAAKAMALKALEIGK